MLAQWRSVSYLVERNKLLDINTLSHEKVLPNVVPAGEVLGQRGNGKSPRWA